jgi:hypothetical protein
MSSLTSQILLGFLFVTIGFISGAAISYWLVEREKANEKNEAIPPFREDTVPMDQAYEEVLRIYREKVSEKIVIKIDGKTMVTRVDLNKPQVPIVEKTIREAMDWIGIQLPKAAPVPPLTTVKPVEAAVQPAAASIPDPEIRRLASSPVTSLRQPEKASNKEKVEARSFVEQIDAILQDMLELTPLKDRKISLVEDPHDGVVAWIGNKRYVGIDAIDDPDVQKLIKIAVAKWEKTMERAARKTP